MSVDQGPPINRAKLRTIEQAYYTEQAYMEATSVIRKQLLRLRRQFLSYHFINPPFWKVLLRSKIGGPRVAPDFASIGAVRSGTSLLSDYIMQHPCVVLPLSKEIGMSAYPMARFVKAQFPTFREMRLHEKNHGRAITGYCTPTMTNLLWPMLASTVNREVKTIVILRNPVERTFAHWRWDQVLVTPIAKDDLWVNYPSFDEYVAIELDAIKAGTASGFAMFSGGKVGGYIQNSVYLPFLKTLHREMNKEHSLVLNANAFFRDPIKTVKRVYDFLELPTYDPKEMVVKNAGQKGTMMPSTREALTEFFAPLNTKLYEYLGEDFGWS